MALERVVAELMERVDSRYFGKYRGIVVDNEDPEHLGRLTLRVPSVLGEYIVTGWALPCVPYGGNPQEGFLFIPAVGAGVWVEFEEGNLEFPVWVGTYWSKSGGGSDLPQPVDTGGKSSGSPQSNPTRKIISTAAGHTIQFEDRDGEEMVTIAEAKYGNVITMDKNGITIKAGTGITLSGQTGHTRAVCLADLLDWLQTHTHVGNLGAPTPLSADSLTLLKSPLLKSTVVTAE